MVIFHSYVSLPEGNPINHNMKRLTIVSLRIRALDLLSAFALRGCRLVLLPAVPLALRALRSYGQDDVETVMVV